MRKKYLIFILLLSLALVYISTLYYSANEKNKILTSEITLLEERNQKNLNDVNNLENDKNKLEEQITILEKRNESYEKSLNNLLDILEEQVTIISAIKSNKNKDTIILPLYTMDIDDGTRKVKSYISLSKGLSLNDKLDIVANKLSKYSFSNLPIEVIDIKEVDGKKIAVVNLNESKENEGIYEPADIKGKTWMFHYFQGTTGGTQTSISLIETFLQKDYEGDWIDGVRFLHNNDENDWYGHVEPLCETAYRND